MGAMPEPKEILKEILSEEELFEIENLLTELSEEEAKEIKEKCKDAEDKKKCVLEQLREEEIEEVVEEVEVGE